MKRRFIFYLFFFLDVWAIGEELEGPCYGYESGVVSCDNEAYDLLLVSKSSRLKVSTV